MACCLTMRGAVFAVPRVVFTAIQLPPVWTAAECYVLGLDPENGAAALGDTDWLEVTEQNKASFRFFKIEVSLPWLWTTERPLQDGRKESGARPRFG